MSVFITFAPSLRRYAYNSALLYNLRILIALAGVAGFLAAAATAADHSPDAGCGCRRADGSRRSAGGSPAQPADHPGLLFIASASIELLFPYPWLFAGGLMLSTVGFILLGALGQRYATIAFGALLIAIYTMLGASMYQFWYQQPLLLLLGAVWYYLLTLIVHLLFPIRPVQEGLARSYSQLAIYLDAKSNLFDPDQEEELNQPLIDVAMANSNLVTTLNQTKLTLLTRLRGDRGQSSTRRMMHYYFVAQDIHEHASSSHFQYQQLSDMFRYSDVLFRFQRLLMLQAHACAQLSQSLILMQHYQHDPRFERAFCHLESTLERIATRHGRQHTLVNSLFNLLINLRAIDIQLANIESEQTLEETREEENTLAEDRITGWHDVLQRIRRQLTPQSALFRHAVRMALVLVVGYAFIQFTGLQHGYWILLTSLFVCQPNYHATKRRLWLRIVGTLAGILIGLPVLYFVPSLEGQLLLIVISGVLFFAFRNVQYAHATMFITLLVLLCFNLLGEGFTVAGPRVFDTLLGCAIAWAAVTFIWPDWHFRQIPAVIARTLNADCRYLDAILVQYHQGKSNALAYRIARRDAHNCDAELASVVSNMSLEPRHSAQSQEAAFRLLCLNHTLLSYISALGAHRQHLDEPVILTLLNDTVCYMDNALNYQDDEVIRRPHQSIEQLQQRLLTVNLPSDSAGQLVLQQISLMLDLLPELTRLKASLA